MNASRPALATARMSRTRRRLVGGVAFGLWSSGAVWLLSHEAFAPVGEFGPSSRGMDAWILMLHGLLGWAGIWCLGLLWGTHVGAGWAQGRRRWTGAALLGIAGLLALSGCGLFYCGDEDIRRWTATLHWILGLIAPAAFLPHRFGASKRARTGRIRGRPA